MNILLTTLNSKYVHSNLAVRYLYTVVCEEYSDIEMREFTINGDPVDIYSEIMRANPKLVCFSCYIWNIDEISLLARDLKLARPELKIALGGPEVSFDAPEFARNNPWADYILTGEGEYPFYRFMEVIHGKSGMTNGADEGRLGLLSPEGLETVPGLVYRQDGVIYVNPGVEPISFDSVPFPYNFLEPEPDRVVYYESSRGCPFGCTYCLSAADKRVRARSIDKVKMELNYFMIKKVRQVKLVDRTFNYNRERAKELIRYILELDKGETAFHLEICADLLDEETIELLGKARKGLFEIETGIQSTNPATLIEIGRSADIELLLANIRRLTGSGNLHVHVDLIAGLPYETYGLFEKSFNEVYALQADALQLGFLKVLKGTPLASQTMKHGIIFRDHAPYEVISTDYISADELVKLHRIEHMLDVYYNRGGFEDSLKYLVGIFENSFGERGAFGFYEALSEYYYGEGYHLKARSKEDNYRILFGFIKSLEDEAFWPEAFGLLDGDARRNMDELNYRRFTRKSWRI